MYTKIDEGNLTNGDTGFIDSTLFNLSKEAILTIDGPISEKEKVDLIERYLTTKNLNNSDYMRKYREIYDFISKIQPYKFEMEDVDLRNILSEEIIPSPVYEKYLGEIREIELKLKDRSIDIDHRVRLKDKLKQYTVSVYPMDVKNYERAKGNGKAMNYDKVMLSNNPKDCIKVIECEYDKVGYRKMKYEKETRKSTIW